MKADILSYRPSNQRTTDRQLTAGLRKNLEGKYTCVLQAAKDEWERCFGSNDPSDACVTVRISESRRPAGGNRQSLEFYAAL